MLMLKYRLNKIVLAAQRIENERRRLSDGQPSPAWIALNQEVEALLKEIEDAENDSDGGCSGLR